MNKSDFQNEFDDEFDSPRKRERTFDDVEIIVETYKHN